MSPQLIIRYSIPFVFLISGSAGLIYEVVWAHQFANILGSTAESLAIVFSVFLVSLAIGSRICAGFSLLMRNPLVSYLILEIGIGLFGGASCLLLLRYEAILLEQLAGSTGAFRLLKGTGVVALAIAPAVVCMGGTLPVLMEGIKKDFTPSLSVAWFYGLNTAGAAVGALLPGYYLVPHIGLSGSALCAVAVNFTVALWILLILHLKKHQRSDLSESDTETAVPVKDTGLKPVFEKGEIPISLFFIISFLSGFIVLGTELCWGRLGRLIVGNRTCATSLLLAGILLSLGAASIFHNRIFSYCSKRWSLKAREYLCWVLVLSAVAQVGCGAFVIELCTQYSFSYVVRCGLYFLLLGPPFFLSGLVFPFILSSYPKLDTDTGRSVGFLYSVNVLGSTLGSFLSTFYLMNTLGTPSTLFLLSSLSVALLPVIYGSEFIRGVALSKVSFASLLLLVCWHLGYPSQIAPIRPGEEPIAVAEDRYGIQVMSRDRNGYIYTSNNNVRLVAQFGSSNTTYAQRMQADIPMLLAHSTKDIFNIGTGYGITAGAFTNWGLADSSLITVELLPFMYENQWRFKEENYSFYSHPSVEFVRNDGRYLLLTSDKSYDIISTNPIDPRLPGSSALCTIDFWEAAKAKLRPHGVYAQLVWGVGHDILVEGFSKVFPEFLMFRLYGASYLLVGGKENSLSQFHFDRLTTDVRTAYSRFGIEDLETYFSLAMKTAELDRDRYLALLDNNPAASLHTSDRPVLEFLAGAGTSMFRTMDEM